MKIAGNNKGLITGLIVIIVLLAGGGGYLLWRVNQKDTLAPTDSSASQERCVDRCTGPCTQNWPFQPPDQCTNDAYKGCTGWVSGGGEFKGCCTYERVCEVTAYYITYIAGPGGSVTNAGQNNVPPGGSISSTATANAGFVFDKWSDGKTTATRTDSNVNADATYTASFKAVAPQTYYITYVAGPGGSVTNAGKNSVPSGGSISSTATANAGFVFDKWSDGKTTATRTDSNVNADATYTASFKAVAPQTYTLKYSVTPYTSGGIVGGTLSGNLNQTVAKGGDGTPVTFVPNKGSYCQASILEWLVNGVKDTTVTGNTRQEKNVQSNMVIEGKSGFIWTTDDTTFRYYAGAHGQIKLGNGAPSTSPITLTFTKGKPCPGTLAVTAVPSSGYRFSHWNDTVKGTKDTGPLAEANPRSDIISVSGGYVPNIAVTAIFVSSSGCGDGVCSNGENISTCPGDCSPVCGDGVCSAGENNSSCPVDCGTTVPQTGIFDDSRNIIATGVLFLTVGISWSYISLLPGKAYEIFSSTSEKIKERSSTKKMVARREKLERKLTKKK